MLLNNFDSENFINNKDICQVVLFIIKYTFIILWNLHEFWIDE